MSNEQATTTGSGGAGGLTGRIAAGPDALLRAEVLEPQLRFEIDALLPWYVQLEKVLLLEYRRLGLLDGAQVGAIAELLDRVTPEVVAREAEESMSDIAFTLERHVTRRLAEVPPAWHVDRSRNDLQATAQSMHGRARLLECAEALIAFGRTAHRLAGRGAELAMPGYTHIQAGPDDQPRVLLLGPLPTRCCTPCAGWTRCTGPPTPHPWAPERWRARNCPGTGPGWPRLLGFTEVRTARTAGGGVHATGRWRRARSSRCSASC